MKSVYQQSIEAIKENYKTNVHVGLSESQAQERLKKYGLNALPEAPRDSLFKVFFSQFKNPLIYILLLAAAIIFFVGDPLDAFIISGVLFFNAIVGTIQEGRTQTILESLKNYLKADAIVIRDGKKHIIEDINLVPGDLIVLQEGEKIPGDARIVENNNLQIDESMLTGESQGVEKTIDIIDQTVPVHDQKNMVFKGTYILSGAGKAIVTQTGTETEIGKFQHSIEGIETDTPLKKSIDQLAHWILLIILGMCIVLFAVGLFFNKKLSELLVMLTALFICVIPEGLPIVFTLSLVSGARRMAQKNMLVKRLQAVEGLGRAEVLIIDKTGTLTRNEMIVTQIYSAQDKKLFYVTGHGYKPEGKILTQDNTVLKSYDNYPGLLKLAHAAALLNRTELEYQKERDTFSIKGNATEAAMLVLGKKFGFTKENLQELYNAQVHMPFSSQYKYQAGIYKVGDSYIAFVSGASEIIMSFAQNVTSQEKEQLATFLDQGYRTIAVGYKKLENIAPTDITIEKVPEYIGNSLELLGFIAIEDAIRPDVKDMVKDVRKAGLKVIMATGDHKDTALFVAKKTGIYAKNDDVIDGSELTKMNDQEIREHLEHTTVYSRVTPGQKLKIIQEWQQKGKRVAMTGDGVNDAPALVAADLGIAMGTMGTEVAKQAADMILLDDSFATIVDAIKEGRNIFFALRRVILYFFTTNMGEVLIIFFALILNLPLPILAAQILWLNLITDGFLDIALAMEPQEKGLLERKMSTDLRLVDLNVFLKMLYMSIPMGIGSLLVFLYYEPYNIVHARTMTLVTMAAFQWFNAWNCRSERLSIFQLNPFGNKWLILATGFVLVLQIFLLHNSFMQKIFRTVPITFTQWCIVVVVASPIFFVEEIRKYIVRNWW